MSEPTPILGYAGRKRNWRRSIAAAIVVVDIAGLILTHVPAQKETRFDGNQISSLIFWDTFGPDNAPGHGVFGIQIYRGLPVDPSNVRHREFAGVFVNTASGYLGVGAAIASLDCLLLAIGLAAVYRLIVGYALIRWRINAGESTDRSRITASQIVK